MGAGAQGRTASCVDDVVAPLVPDIAAEFALPIKSAVALSSRRAEAKERGAGRPAAAAAALFTSNPIFWNNDGGRGDGSSII
jgi:hypothetical protein